MGSSEKCYEISLNVAAYNIAVDRNEVEGEKILIDASIEGNCNTVEQLLKSGICADAKEYNKLLFYASKNYFTPLQLATLHGHEKCAQLLIDYGADVNAKDLYGLTSLHLAACNGSYNILKILLKARAACSAPIKCSYCIPVKKYVKPDCKFLYIDGTTPLHIAASINNIDCVKELIRYGADFNAVDEHGRTSLYVAAQRGYSECVLIHLKEAVGHDILSLPSFKTSDTPLHFAVKYEMMDCIKELLYLGSDVNHRNFEGRSPLHVSLISLNPNLSVLMEILKLLVLEGHKTDINLPDMQNFTPFHYVCYQGSHNMWIRKPELAKFLIAYGADVNFRDCLNRKILVQELKYPEKDFEILKYIVKSMLYLPRLKDLNIIFEGDLVFNKENRNRLDHQNNSDRIRVPFQRHLSLDSEEDFSEPEFMEFDNSRLRDHLIEIRSTLMDDDDNYMTHTGSQTQGQNTLQNPERDAHMLFHNPDSGVLDTIYLAYNEAINEDRNRGDPGIDDDYDMTEHDTNIATSLIIKKQMWYEEMASKPRTLQHHCRFLIRKTLGPMKLKYVKRLPLPAKLHSYLMFELEE